MISFAVLGTPAPQGSLRRVGRVLKCDNPATMPFRQAVGWAALKARADAGIHEIFADKHVPVKLRAVFVFSIPKKFRLRPSVKPDVDKLCRSVCDALTGILWVDDGQVIELYARKIYGAPARTEIEVEILEVK